jgi:hypothetical protein
MSIISDGISAIISPIRGYLIAGALVAAIGAFTYWSLHERHVEHVKDVAVATKEVQKVNKADVVIEGNADKAVAAEETKHAQDATAPPVSDIGLVCHDAGPNSVPGVPASNGTGNHAADSGEGTVFDPSGPVLTVGRKYDQWVRELQADNAALRKELDEAHKVHPK